MNSSGGGGGGVETVPATAPDNVEATLHAHYTPLMDQIPTALLEKELQKRRGRKQNQGEASSADGDGEITASEKERGTTSVVVSALELGEKSSKNGVVSGGVVRLNLADGGFKNGTDVAVSNLELAAADAVTVRSKGLVARATMQHLSMSFKQYISAAMRGRDRVVVNCRDSFVVANFASCSHGSCCFLFTQEEQKLCVPKTAKDLGTVTWLTAAIARRYAAEGAEKLVEEIKDAFTSTCSVVRKTYLKLIMPYACIDPNDNCGYSEYPEMLPDKGSTTGRALGKADVGKAQFTKCSAARFQSSYAFTLHTKLKPLFDACNLNANNAEDGFCKGTQEMELQGGCGEKWQAALTAEQVSKSTLHLHDTDVWFALTRILLRKHTDFGDSTPTSQTRLFGDQTLTPFLAARISARAAKLKEVGGTPQRAVPDDGNYSLLRL